MFSHRVSAIFRITDSFTEEPIANGIFKAKLDGRAVKLLYKGDGYFLLMNCEGGTHEIEFESSIYLKEKLGFELKAAVETFVLTLKPAERYPYGANAKTFEGEAKGDFVWIAPIRTGAELKIAEAEAKAGADEAAVFVPASMSKHSYPDNFLISDADAKEIVCIGKIDEGKAKLTEVLKNPHKRGTKLYHAIRVKTEEGRYRAIFRNIDSVEVYEI